MDSDSSTYAPRSRALRRRQAASRRSTSPKGPAVTYVVRVDLAYADPPLWRRLELASDLRLHEVHTVLQAAFEWEGDHLHDFRRYDGPGGKTVHRLRPARFIEVDDDAAPEHKVRLDAVLRAERDQLEYLYDFGDSWLHVLTLEQVTPRMADAPRARVVAGERAAPPEDCGGILGYEDLCAVLADPAHPDHEDMCEWFEGMSSVAAGDFDPALLDLERVDALVQRASR